MENSIDRNLFVERAFNSAFPGVKVGFHFDRAGAVVIDTWQGDTPQPKPVALDKVLADHAAVEDAQKEEQQKDREALKAGVVNMLGLSKDQVPTFVAGLKALFEDQEKI
jgi:hypothetical protein